MRPQHPLVRVLEHVKVATAGGGIYIMSLVQVCGAFFDAAGPRSLLPWFHLKRLGGVNFVILLEARSILGSELFEREGIFLGIRTLALEPVGEGGLLRHRLVV